MTTATYVADQLDAVRSLAQARGLREVHDSGPCGDVRLVTFGDGRFARDYLRGRGLVGVAIEVVFTHRGEVSSAYKIVDGKPRATVTAERGGSAGERLLAVLQMVEGCWR